MRDRLGRIKGVLHYLGRILQILALVMLFPLIAVFWYWRAFGDGWDTVWAFVCPAAASLMIGTMLRILFPDKTMDAAGSLILCALGWIVVAGLGAVPFVMGIHAPCLDAYFEAMSGFTTTGITVFSGLDTMPRSILLWRSLTQWLGGIGILSFFLVVTLPGGAAHHIYGAESHKIGSSRPVPGMLNTVKILWGIYSLFTLMAIIAFAWSGQGVFDGLCHACTALSTGGFSPHDSSIEFYRQDSTVNFRLIEYTVTFFMLLGGINFLVHYRVMTGNIKALWDNAEVRYWWGLLGGFTGLICLEHLARTGTLSYILSQGFAMQWHHIEDSIRTTLFQVVSLMTTTGFGTRDIGSDYFGVAAKQLFLVMMVIGGCVGSTGGGFKVLRVVILNRLMLGEVFRARVSPRASTGVVIDGKPVPEREVQRVAGLFFGWMALLLLGGLITALLSQHGPLASLSGMFSALGNIGPCYISVADMIQIHPAVKVTYIVGMLAGRLEILPVLLLFSWKAWR